jgi:hypothetical protein
MEFDDTEEAGIQIYEDRPEVALEAVGRDRTSLASSCSSGARNRDPAPSGRGYMPAGRDKKRTRRCRLEKGGVNRQDVRDQE